MSKSFNFLKMLIITIFSASLITGCGQSADDEKYHLHAYTAKVIEPTCQEGGYTIYTCSICGSSYEGDYTEPVDHTENSKRCAYCGMCYWNETVKIVKKKGTFNSTKKVYQLPYTATNYTTYLQFETSDNTLWLINAYDQCGTMALCIPETGWNCFFCYVLLKYEFYKADMNSYKNWIAGSIYTQDIKYSNRTTLLPLSGSNIVSSLKDPANKACHEQMFIACSSLFFMLIDNKCEFSNPHLGFINWEY